MAPPEEKFERLSLTGWMLISDAELGMACKCLKLPRLRSQAWKEVHRRWDPLFLRFLVALGDKRNAAEDILGKAYVQACKCIDTLEDCAVIKPWLFTIVKNEWASYYRRPDAVVSLEEFETVDDQRASRPVGSPNRT